MIRTCVSRTPKVMKKRQQRTGAVTVEYLLLVTLVGIGVLVGLAAVRTALDSELQDVAAAISNIVIS